MDGVSPQVIEELDTLEAIFGSESFHNRQATRAWAGVKPEVHFDLDLSSLNEDLRGRVSCSLHFK